MLIVFCVLAAISSIGFASGISFFKINGIDKIKSFSGCFEFGLLEIMNGERLSVCVLASLASSGEIALVCVLSSISSLMYIMNIVNVFGVSFKCGVSFACISFLLGRSIETVIFFVFHFAVCGATSFFALQIFERRVYHFKLKRFDSTDGAFFKLLIFELLCIALTAVIFDTLIVLSKNEALGIINTIV